NVGCALESGWQQRAPTPLEGGTRHEGMLKAERCNQGKIDDAGNKRVLDALPHVGGALEPRCSRPRRVAEKDAERSKKQAGKPRQPERLRGRRQRRSWRSSIGHRRVLPPAARATMLLSHL